MLAVPLVVESLLFDGGRAMIASVGSIGITTVAMLLAFRPDALWWDKIRQVVDFVTGFAVVTLLGWLCVYYREEVVKGERQIAGSIAHYSYIY